MTESERSTPQPQSQVVLDETSCAAAENVEEERLDTLSADVHTNVTATVDRKAGVVLHLLSLSIMHSAPFLWELGPSYWKAELPLVVLSTGYPSGMRAQSIHDNFTGSLHFPRDYLLYPATDKFIICL